MGFPREVLANVVTQGASTTVGRPPTTEPVIWIGSAEPANANIADIWLDSDAPVDLNFDGGVAQFIDNTAGIVSDTLAAIPDPADAPGSADILRDDLVANTLPVLRDSVSSLAAKTNALLTALSAVGLGTGLWKYKDVGTWVDLYTVPPVTPTTSKAVDWTALTDYTTNTLVVEAGVLYRALADFTSGAVFDPANWEIVESSLTGRVDALEASSILVVAPEATGNDSAALQALFDQLALAGGGTLVLRLGATYVLGAKINLSTNAYSNITVDGNGATIQAAAALADHMFELGSVSAPSNVVFHNVQFDDNAAARVSGQHDTFDISAADKLRFLGCSFVNLMYHYIATGGVTNGSIDIDTCVFTGTGVEPNYSLLYFSNINSHHRVSGCRFIDCGDAATAAQALYVNGTKSLRVTGCYFENVGQAVDTRATAANVVIADCMIVGGAAGSLAALGHALRLTSTGVLVVGVSIYNWQNTAAVIRTGTTASRCVFVGCKVRLGTVPATQSVFRIGGSDHRILACDVIGMAAGNNAIFNLTDQPTECEIIGNVTEAGPNLFRIVSTQVTVAARISSNVVRAATKKWINEANATGDTAVAMLVENSARLFPVATYTVTNVTTDRSYDANATTLDELADVVGTLIADLRTAGTIA